MGITEEVIVGNHGRDITIGVIIDEHHRRGSSENVIMEGSSEVIMELSGEKIMDIGCWISLAAEGLRKGVKDPWAEGGDFHP